MSCHGITALCDSTTTAHAFSSLCFRLSLSVYVSLFVRNQCVAELSVAEMALRKRVRESAWFDNNYLDFRAPFAAADREGNGRLSVQQFQEAIARLGVAMSPQELHNLARRLDSNADGTIDYYEFAKLVDLDPSELYVRISPAVVLDAGQN